MTTEKQKAANRENSKKSTGPKTEEGKQRSSQNALRHGIYSLRSVIPGEDPAEFDRLCTEFAERFRPDDPYERSLVRQMADAEWRLRRISRIEADYLGAATESSRDNHKEWRSKEPMPGEGRLLGRAMQTRTADLLAIARYEAHLSRRLRQAHQALMESRKQERQHDRPADHRPVRPNPRDHSTPREPFYHPAGDPFQHNNESVERSRLRPSHTESSTSDPPGQINSDDPAA